MSEWIKCDERLPDATAWVLVYADEAINCMAYYNGCWENWGEVSNIRIDDITHWMPLPEPPEAP